MQYWVKATGQFQEDFRADYIDMENYTFKETIIYNSRKVLYYLKYLIYRANISNILVLTKSLKIYIVNLFYIR